MDKEIAGLMEYGTWDEIPVNAIPSNSNVTKSKWVFAVKYNRDGTVERFKARFVVCGYSQVKGVDYDRSFSATLKASSMRLLFAVAAKKKLSIEHCDISNAFVQAPLDDHHIFVTLAKGYGRPGCVLKLKKSLYGTKQASRLFQLELRKKLVAMGFKPSTSDPCIFSLDSPKGRMIVGAYVDDLLVLHDNVDLFDKFMDTILNPSKGGFAGKHLGKLDWFLGIGIDITDDYVQMSQKKYIQDLVHKFAPSKTHFSHSTPCTVDSISALGPPKDDVERARVSKLPYMQLIGSLLYVSTMTRPDIAFVMSHLCQHMSDPNESCYDLALKVLLYLDKSQDLCIRFSNDESSFAGLDADRSRINDNLGFACFSDASWGGKAPAYGFCCFLANGPVSFAAKKLKSAESSCEAEYSAAYQAAREISFLRNVLEDIGFGTMGATVLGVDNTAAIDVANDYGVTARTKHFERVVHFLRETVSDLRIKLVFVRTVNQLADIFTKPLGKTDFLRLRRSFLLVPELG